MNSGIPSAKDLWFLPLGGCGEIGMNLNLYGHDGQWLMVDCGVAFAKPQAGDRGKALGRNGIFCADPTFIASRRRHLICLVVTHAHEDHVGAVPYLWPQLQCPVYAAPFTAEILKRKLAQRGLLEKVPLYVIDTREKLTLGNFELEWLSLTHSIPEPQALLIRTRAGNIFHTADWKLDPDPVVGDTYHESHFRALARESIVAMVCDSTNATNPGRSHSEGELVTGLLNAVRSAEGRVIATCFGSNVGRLQTLVRIAGATGRYAGLLGRSLHNMVRAARATGYWPDELKLAAPPHLGYLPKREVLAIATGSQGEARTALQRLIAGNHPDLELEAGDTVIFSSKVIPGNELAVQAMIEKLRAADVRVVDSATSEHPIHASGHPCREELRDLYGWVQPKIAVPVHGEARHLAANAEIARQCGVPAQLTGQNGDLFILAPQTRVRRKFADVGVVDLTVGNGD